MSVKYLFLIFLVGCSAIKTHLLPTKTLKQTSSKPIGVAVSYQKLKQEDLYKTLVLQEFDSITTENSLKMEAILAVPGKYDFSQADYLLDFSVKNNLRFRAHPLVWHRQLPGWLVTKNYKEIEIIFENYIKTVVSHYRGKVYSWDVVNEAFLSNGNYRNSVWHLVIGPDYIEKAFFLAHENDPNAKLYYNDFGIEKFGPKFEAVFAMLERLVRKGVPINGVGLQTHIKANSNLEDLHDIIQKIGSLGLEVEITEFDVALRNSASQKELKQQENAFRKVVQVCSKLKNCKGITFWGLDDSSSWIDGEIPGFGRATLFDKNYLPKKAYYSVLEGLR